MCTTKIPGLLPPNLHLSVAEHAVTITADNMIVLGVREVKTAYPNARHVVPAGRLQVNEGTPYLGVLAEYQEELGLNECDLAELVCIGAVSDLLLGMRSLEFVFYGKTRLTAKEVLQRARGAKSANEHVQLEVFPWDPDFLLNNVLLPYPRRFVPAGWAGIILAMRFMFGAAGNCEWGPESGVQYMEYLKTRNETKNLN